MSAPGLRSPDQVMRLERMGVAFPTRLSFLRTLMRDLRDDNASVTRPVWNVDADGFGHAVYTVHLGGHAYSLVAVATELADSARTDRVIATAWDTTYVLYDGIPDGAEIARICAQAPLQEAGRFSPRDLVLCRANKSVRLFAHVVGALRAGRQPDAVRIRDTGYLMRTTAVYGNGKFGIADRARIAGRPGLSGPFMAEMLTVWLIRGFTHDLAEHLGGAPLARHLKRQLGIGNATGLGMAPFLVSHPLLLDAWMSARETALARVRGVERLNGDQIARIGELAARVGAHLDEWRVPDLAAQGKIELLRDAWAGFAGGLTAQALAAPYAIDGLVNASQQGSTELQELVVAFVLEPFGALIDDLADTMATSQVPRMDAGMSLAALRAAMARDWGWALGVDYRHPEHSARFWYVSEAKQEPRLGERHDEPGADRESPLDIGRQAKALAGDLEGAKGTLPEFLRAHPEHRAVVRRVQTVMRHPYAEIRDNLIGADTRPIDMLRCKLAFFGAAKFDPKSDRWTRVNLVQGAPLFDELDMADDWFLPRFDQAEARP